MELRETIRAGDETVVRQIVASTAFFTAAEIEVAVELVLERLRRGAQSGYCFLFAELNGKPVGYTCYGPIACTVGSFDVYWIVVHREFQNQGLGRVLLRGSEDRIARAGGRRIYVETSSRDQYGPTRRFYEHFGYRQEAVLPDFYAPGDGKVIYCKSL